MRSDLLLESDLPGGLPIAFSFPQPFAAHTEFFSYGDKTRNKSWHPHVVGTNVRGIPHGLIADYWLSCSTFMISIPRGAPTLGTMSLTRFGSADGAKFPEWLIGLVSK